MTALDHKKAKYSCNSHRIDRDQPPHRQIQPNQYQTLATNVRYRGRTGLCRAQCGIDAFDPEQTSATSKPLVRDPSRVPSTKAESQSFKMTSM